MRVKIGFPNPTIRTPKGDTHGNHYFIFWPHYCHCRSILTVIQSRNAIRPSLKITKVQNNGCNTVIEIELGRMPFCYRIRSVSTLGWMPPKILDYGMGCYDPNTPQHPVPSRKVKPAYWINADLTASASCRFWFVIAPSKQHIWLRITFFSISFPWRSSYEIPTFNQDSTIV